MTAVKKQELQFQVQQLRMDKVIYAVDAIAVCFAVFLILLSLPVVYIYLPNLPQQTSIVLLAVAVGSVLYAIVGNILRLKKVRQLEAELEGN
jgi:integral membrane sensor domain MASE1